MAKVTVNKDQNEIINVGDMFVSNDGCLYVLAVLCPEGKYVAVSISSGGCWRSPDASMAYAVGDLRLFHGSFTVEQE